MLYCNIYVYWAYYSPYSCTMWSTFHNFTNYNVYSVACVCNWNIHFKLKHMTINLKEMARETLDKIPGEDLEAVVLFGVTDKGHLACTIAGAPVPLKAMIATILEDDKPRALFEECYSAVLARRAGMSENDSIDFNNN